MLTSSEDKSPVDGAQVPNKHDGEGSEDITSTGIWIWRVASGVVSLSAEMNRLLFGSSGQSDMSFEEFLESIHPEDLPTAELSLNEARDFAKVRAFECRTNPSLGSIKILHVSLFVRQNELGKLVSVTGSVLDLTKLRERSVEFDRLSRLYQALSGVNQAIVWTRNREELFHKICQILTEKGGFRMAWIAWREPGTNHLKAIASSGDLDGFLREIAVNVDEVPEGMGPSGIAFREERPCIWPDTQFASLDNPWQEAQVEHGLLSSASFPIRELGRVAGTLNVYADQVGGFGEKEVALLCEAAGDVSFALDNLAKEKARLKAELTVRRERDFSDALLKSLPGVFYLYDHAGSFLRWNSNFERVSGYSASEIQGMHPLDFFGETDKELVASRIEEVFVTGESRVDAGFLCKDGTVIPYHFTGVNTEIDGKNCLLGVGFDDTERQEAQRALAVLKESLAKKVAERTRELQVALVHAESADRLKSSFLATMSHELRTPLNSIIGFTSILLQRLAGPLTDEQEKQLSIVRDSSRHLLELINDVLDLSRIEADQLKVICEPFELRHSVERVMGSVRPQARKKGLDLRISLFEAVELVCSDRRRVEQILLNLLSNAIKFTKRGEVTLQVETRGSSLILRVSDTGIGIKSEDMSTLFMPFRQIDASLSRKHEGTGLGLVICSRLTRILGGDISVRSEWAKGSEFTVTLPIKGGLE